MSASVTAPAAADVDAVAVSYAVQTKNLTRRFGEQVAVDDVSLRVPRGAVYGFLGPNGSGKTTTIRMLLGLLSSDSGSIDVLGHRMPDELSEALPLVGALIEGPAFHPYLSGWANLARMDACDQTMPAATSSERIGLALERVGLSIAAKKRYRHYSLGMKQRLGLAAALLRPRELLILDEPTNGLDPQGTREVRHLIGELASDGTTILLSSHLLSEIEQVASHVGIMSTGRLLRQGTVAEVLADGRAVLRMQTPDVTIACSVLRGLGLEPSPTADGDAVTAPLDGRDAAELARCAVAEGVRLYGLAVERPDLEDLFVSLTGEGFDVRQ